MAAINTAALAGDAWLGTYTTLHATRIVGMAFITTAAVNLTTYYRMQGYDTTSSALKQWTVADTPDTTAARHPTPTAVTITGAYIIDRWQA